jgi:hypothetical protein
MNIIEALQDVDIAFRQLEFAIKLLSYCELGRIEPLEFDTDHTVLLDSGNLGFPAGNFSEPENIIRAAMVSVSLAFGASALALDKAYEVAGIAPEPTAANNTIKLRTLVYMVRCAYAHGIADPKWEVRGKYNQVISVELAFGRVEINLKELNGKEFDFSHLGGHHLWFKIRDESVASIKELEDQMKSC